MGGFTVFLRDGTTFNPLDVPFSGVTETQAYGINNNGEIVGFYNDASGGHGFILVKGQFIRFDASFPGISDINFTVPLGINDLGEIVGIYGRSPAAGQEFSFLAQP